MKPELRAQYRRARAGIDKTQRQSWTAELNRRLLAAPEVTSAGCVGGFLAFDGEPDIRFTLTQLARRGIKVALPVLPAATAPQDQGLAFRFWTPATPLNPNRFGISEPQGTPTVAITALDVLLIPLVAWDRSGLRLGMGGGWYDRTLGQEGMRARRVGVGWGLQEAEALPREPWDQALDAMVTENGWFTFAEAGGTMAADHGKPSAV